MLAKRYYGPAMARAYRSAATHYAGKAMPYLGSAAAGYAGSAAYNRKRKAGAQGGGGKRQDIGGRPANDDTRTNLNSTFNSVSLYSKRRKSTKRLKFKKKTFATKVKKVINKQPQTSFWTISHSNQLSIAPAASNSYQVQDLFGRVFSYGWQLASGQLNDTAAVAKDLTHIYIKLRNYGHIESSAIVSDATRNVDVVKFWYAASYNFDIQCFNNEYTDTNPLYCDIYECLAASNISESDYATPADAWVNSLALQNAAFTGDTVSTALIKGATPKECALFKKYWSIVKVTRIRIASPAPFHYDMHTKGIYNSQTARDVYCIKGQTKGIMIVAAPIMTTTNPANYNFQLTAMNKKFRYKCLPYAGHQPALDRQNGQTITTV